MVSCFCLFLLVCFSICSAVYLYFFNSCVEKSLRTFWLTITEVSTQWTITVESLISNNSHAKRELTLAIFRKEEESRKESLFDIKKKKKSTVSVGADSLKCWTEGKKDVEVELVKLGSAQMITVSQIHAEWRVSCGTK